MLINGGVYSLVWRAGTLPGIDIIGINYSDNDVITIGKDPAIIFENNKEVTFQIKRKNIRKDYKAADYTIALDSKTKKETI